MVSRLQVRQHHPVLYLQFSPTRGLVQIVTAGTEMGQGLFIKVEQVVADELGIGVERIRTTASDTSKVPNASATAASSGSDMNGKAAQKAAAKIRKRLTAFAAHEYGVSEAEIDFRGGRVYVADRIMEFQELTNLAWLNRISVSATGFYRLSCSCAEFQ